MISYILQESFKQMSSLCYFVQNFSILTTINVEVEVINRPIVAGAVLQTLSSLKSYIINLYFPLNL